jgi:hypothetical protein
MTTSAPRPNLNPLALPTLALAGRAVLTFRNVESGTHFTARIKQRTSKQDRKVKLPAYNVKISMSGDHETGFRYVGQIFTDDPSTLRMWVARELKNDDPIVSIFSWMVGVIANPIVLRGTPSKVDGLVHNRVHLFHENKCCHCGLPLTHPESVYTGIGPVCMKNLERELAAKDIKVSEIFAPTNQA